MVKAWLQRQTRKLGNMVYQFKHDYQFDKTLYFFYYGNRDTELYSYLDKNYWAKNTKLPIYHLMDFGLLMNIPCQGTNTTAENFVLLIQKNSTYSPCFCLNADTIEKTQYLLGNMTEYVNETPDLDSVKIKDIRHVKPFILPLFEKKEQYFLILTHEPRVSNPQYTMYQEFCHQTKSQCFYTITPGTPKSEGIDADSTLTFSEFFLGYDTKHETDYSIPRVYFIDNTETFPSIKYKIDGPFKNSGELKRFKKAIIEKEWEPFYVSEPPIIDEQNGKFGVLAVTRENYKQEIKAFRGDVVLMLVNSQNMGSETTQQQVSQDSKFLRLYYALAEKIRHQEGAKHIKFLAIDTLKNDLPEFRGLGTPVFLLYDYLEKKQTRLSMYEDLDLSYRNLLKQAPVFSDPNLEDL